MDYTILNNLKEYLQLLIDNGIHKIVYNEEFYEEKVIDCINAIDEVKEKIEILENENIALNKLIDKEME